MERNKFMSFIYAVLSIIMFVLILALIIKVYQGYQAKEIQVFGVIERIDQIHEKNQLKFSLQGNKTIFHTFVDSKSKLGLSKEGDHVKFIQKEMGWSNIKDGTLVNDSLNRD